MAVISYDYLNQDIQATALVQVRDDDSFFNPGLGHYGFAADGTRYTAGIQDAGPVFASWYSEIPGPYRGPKPTFPNAGLILLSKVALTILDETTRDLILWMQFLLADNQALTDNFDGGINSWTPRSLNFADGVLSVTYEADEGNTDIVSPMVATFDFTQDKVYTDIAM